MSMFIQLEVHPRDDKTKTIILSFNVNSINPFGPFDGDETKSLMWSSDKPYMVNLPYKELRDLLNSAFKKIMTETMKGVSGE